MAPVTEICYISLKPGVELTGSSTSAQAWSDTIKTIQAQDGYQRLHWGTTMENESLLVLLIDWDNLTSHQKFTHAPSYTPFKQLLGSIMTGVHLFHITPTPFPPSILRLAPVIEFAAFYSPDPIFLGNMGKFAGNLEEKRKEGLIDGFYGTAYGESVEDGVVKHAEQGEEQRVKEEKGGKVVVAFIGWESKEKHLAFRETETFKQNIGLLRGNNRGAELFHVKFVAVD
ncbi:hypothetical protein V8E51_000458 [Hyaloscypha variabilis]